MPVVMGFERLDETGAFLGRCRRGPGQQPRVFKDAIGAGRAAGDLVGIEHHEGQPAIAFERMRPREGADPLLFIVGEPVVAWHPGVVLVDLAVAFLPVVEFGGAQADPTEETADGNLGLLGLGVDEIDKVIAGVMRHPAMG